MISIVTTSFNNSSTLDSFIQKLFAALEARGLNEYEIIIVDDGSRDDEVESIEKIISRYDCIIFRKLSRNFGHHPALLRGLELSKGEEIFLIDSDLEEDPAWLGLFVDTLRNSSYDVVYGVQESRRGSIFEVVSGNLYYWIINNILGMKIPRNFMTVRLMKRNYVDNLLKHGEFNVNLAGLMSITGHNQFELKLKKHRLRKSSYTFSKKIQIVVNSITSFSERPLLLVLSSGVIISLLAWLEIAMLLIARFVYFKPLAGWLSIFVAVQFFGGLILLSNGFIGLYVAKIFSEVKNRPRTLELD